MHSRIRKPSLSLMSLCPSSLVSSVSLVKCTLTNAEILNHSCSKRYAPCLGSVWWYGGALQLDYRSPPGYICSGSPERLGSTSASTTHVLPFSSEWNHKVYPGGAYVCTGIGCTLGPANWAHKKNLRIEAIPSMLRGWESLWKLFTILKRWYNMYINCCTYLWKRGSCMASQSPKKEEHLAKIETAMGGAIHCSGTA